MQAHNGHTVWCKNNTGIQNPAKAHYCFNP